MWKKYLLYIIGIIIIICLGIFGCRGDEEPVEDIVSETPESEPVTPEPSPAYINLSNSITGIDATDLLSLADILSAVLDIDYARTEGLVTEAEATDLEGDLTNKFDSWIRVTVDGIDPTQPESIKDFFDLQAVQRTSEYEDLVSPATKQYKEEQMTEKFNQWIRARVDEINPQDQGALKDMFDLQVIQRTAKYEELTTADTAQYKEEQMGEKLNDWVRNRVDEIDPSDPDNLKYFFWMQKIQANEKYDRFATPETHEYKERQMKQKFNEWVEARVNDLDPDDPDFLEDLEMLRVIQRSDKYAKFITRYMHEWKENSLKEKMADYVTNLVNALNPIAFTFWQDLADLAKFQLSDVYQEFCPELIKQDKQDQLARMVTQPSGLPPLVAGVYPQHGQIEASLDSLVMVVFDQPMEPASLERAIKISPVIPYDLVTPTEESFIALLVPHQLLDELTTYTITTNEEAISLAGLQLMRTYEFSFRTGEARPAPRVIASLPEGGTVDEMAGDPIVITFDQPMLPLSVESAISISPAYDYSVVWADDDATVVIQSHYPLAVNTDYEVTVGPLAQSADGVPLGEGYRFGFNTGIMNLPQVLGTLPYTGQVGIPSNHPLQIVFDRSMDTASVEDLIEVSPYFEYQTSWFEADMVLEINPLSPLPVDTYFTITVNHGVRSSFGLPMEDGFVFSFTTEK